MALCRFKDRLNTRPHDVYLELTLYRSFHAFSLAEDCTCSVLSLGDYMSKPKRPAFEVHAEGNLKESSNRKSVPFPWDWGIDRGGPLLGHERRRPAVSQCGHSGSEPPESRRSRWRAGRGVYFIEIRTG